MVLHLLSNLGTKKQKFFLEHLFSMSTGDISVDPPKLGAGVLAPVL